MNKKRVLIVDDHEIVRAGLEMLLRREDDIEVVAVAATAEEALTLMNDVVPDIAVIDYGLPKMTGVELCEHIGKNHPAVAVIMLTSFLDDQVIHSSLKAGAKAYVYKDVEAKDLKRAIRTVAQGGLVLDPKVAGRVLRWARRRGPSRLNDRDHPLSIRETDVLRMVARGATNIEIAQSMGVSVNTVKTYLQRALGKLGCHNRAEAAKLASKWGLL